MVEVLHVGYGSKEGGRIKTWKRRYFVLRTATEKELETAPDGLSHFLVYYKERPAFLEVEPAGAIQLFQGRSTASELVRKNSRALKVTTPVYGNRDFFFIPEDSTERWREALNNFEAPQDSVQEQDPWQASHGSQPVFEVNATVLATDDDDDDDYVAGGGDAGDDTGAESAGVVGVDITGPADLELSTGGAPAVPATVTVVVARTVADQSFGVRLAMETDGGPRTLGLVVTAVARGTPASTAGLRPGTNVTKITQPGVAAAPLAGLTVPELSAAISAATATALRIEIDVATNCALTQPPAAASASAAGLQPWTATVAREGKAAGFGVVLCGASPIIGEGWVGSVADQAVFVSRVVAGSAAASTTGVWVGAGVTSINCAMVVDIHQAAKLLASAGETLVLELAAGPAWLASPASTKPAEVQDASGNGLTAGDAAAAAPASAGGADSAAGTEDENSNKGTAVMGGTFEC